MKQAANSTTSFRLDQVGQYLVVTRDGSDISTYQVSPHGGSTRSAVVYGGQYGYIGDMITFDDDTVQVGQRMRLKLRGRTEISASVTAIYNTSNMTQEQVEQLMDEAGAGASRP